MVDNKTEIKKKRVVIAPHAFATMVAYAAKYSTSSVHGVVVGTTTSDTINVTNIFPICHDETPTKPLVDTALALVASSLEEDSSSSKDKIIGWFTAPELLQDNTPGPVPLRIVATMDYGVDDTDKVLLLVRNEEITNIIQDVDSTVNQPKAIEAFGKDFGNQWMESLEVTITNEGDAETLARKLASDETITDLVDHWKAVSTSKWSQAQHFC